MGESEAFERVDLTFLAGVMALADAPSVLALRFRFAILCGIWS
jgi:hypothetical protein